MPLHSYQCGSCGFADDEYHKKSAPEVMECPHCQAPTYRKQVSLPHAPQLGYHKPITMYSAAVNTIEEIHRLQKMCPDAEIADKDYNDPLWGVPVAKSRTAKLQVLKARGLQEKTR